MDDVVLIGCLSVFFVCSFSFLRILYPNIERTPTLGRIANNGNMICVIGKQNKFMYQF